MNITSKNTHIIQISVEELTTLLKEHFQLNGDVQVIITEKSVHPQEPTKKSDSGWQEHKGWVFSHPPRELDGVEYIEVRYRDGFQDTGYPTDWHVHWKDDNEPRDIVAYRIIG